MTPYLQAEKLSKRFGELLLFENISFTIFEGQKVALIARNGAGKTTLLNLLAGIDSPESGLITLKNDIRIGYFEQYPKLNPENSVISEIFESENEKLIVIKEFEWALNGKDENEIARLTAKIDGLNAWDAEVKIKQILTTLKISDFDQKVKHLSGGQQKRLALAKILIDEPDLLILDEPTNHLDLEMIEWLEEFLQKTNATMLMVTHDRYFLDRVCNEIIEMEDNQIYRYKGNYSYYIEKREQRLEMQEAATLKAKNLLRTEIEWMRRMPKARSHKAKYRIDSFYELKEKAQQKRNDDNIQLTVNSARLGKKIIEIENLSKSYGELKLIDDFSYKFARFEKVGLIGNNGTGKTTFLNLITKTIKADSGVVDIGQTIRFGYYRQEGITFNQDEKVIDAVNKIAEYIHFEDGSKMSSSQLLSRFLFPNPVQYSLISTLSGGEKRRLYLCTVLMQNPNFLILDEPTNDLDIITLNILEDYLADFAGCVVVVSHDRFFMDKIVDHLFVFEGNGLISDFPGNYTIYRDWLDSKNQMEKQKSPTVRNPKQKPVNNSVKKLTFNEKREFEQLSEEIEKLETSIKNIEDELNFGNLQHELLFKKSEDLNKMKELLDEKELRWLELSELA
ncbi:MAG: ABC-F family ATP-binding cassette domain-containing protein [Prolixibacteraceae bacterium]|nr:ABC-F family ATP-binding cassette domain-containing protein [Prolixibacteraceae bacterium]